MRVNKIVCDVTGKDKDVHGYLVVVTQLTEDEITGVNHKEARELVDEFLQSRNGPIVLAQDVDLGPEAIERVKKAIHKALLPWPTKTRRVEKPQYALRLSGGNHAAPVVQPPPPAVQ